MPADRLASLLWGNPWLQPRRAVAPSYRQPCSATCNLSNLAPRRHMAVPSTMAALPQVSAANLAGHQQQQQASRNPQLCSTCRSFSKAKHRGTRLAAAAAAGGMLQPSGDGARRKKFAAASEEEEAAGRVEVPPSIAVASQEETYSLENTRVRTTRR
jgi:hypothetical protein